PICLSDGGGEPEETRGWELRVVVARDLCERIDGVARVDAQERVERTRRRVDRDRLVARRGPLVPDGGAAVGVRNGGGLAALERCTVVRAACARIGADERRRVREVVV